MPGFITADISATIAGLNDIQRNQLPYATALFLTRLAKAGQAAVRTGLRQHFTLRNTWTERGVRIEAARKSAGIQMFSAVTFARDYMVLHETSGVKLPHKGRRYLAIPIAKELKSQIIPDHLRPKWLLGQRGSRPLPKLFTKSEHIDKRARRIAATFGKGFVITSKGKAFIMLRYGPREADVKVMYYLAPMAQIKADLHMYETVADVVRTISQSTFATAMAEATQTARGGEPEFFGS